VEFIQHVNTRAEVIARDIPALEQNLKTEYPAAAQRYRTALSTGKTSSGETVTPEMRKSFEVALGLYQFFLSDMTSTPIVPGTLVVQDGLTLYRGERTIVIKYLGRGNTAGDLIVHLPRERIVATGDLVVHPVPFAFFSHLGDWPGTLRALKQIEDEHKKILDVSDPSITPIPPPGSLRGTGPSGRQREPAQPRRSWPRRRWAGAAAPL